MVRRVATKGGSRRTAAGLGEQQLLLDDAPLSVQASHDGKRVIVIMPYEVWMIGAATLELEKNLELSVARPSVFETEEDGILWIGGQHLHRGNLWSATVTKVGTKLGGFVDRVCVVRPRLLCAVGSHGEVLWDFEQETEIHRRKSAEHEVCGLVATPDGRALWADGSPHGWVIDPDHPSGYMKLPMRRTSVDAVESEGIVALGLSSEGRCILAARDGAVAWTNRALRLETERFLAGSSRCLPLAVAGDDRWIYVLRPGAVVHRFLIAQPEPEPGTKQEPEPLPEAQTVRLSRPATCLALVHDHLVLGGPQADDQLGRLWRERTEDLQWEPLRLGQRVLVEPVPPAPDTTPKKPDFTPTKSKLQGPPISAIRVDDVLAGSPEFWITRGQGLLLERPIAVASPDEVLPGDALLLPAMLRLHEGTSRPGLVLWPGVADEQRAVPPLLWLTWGDQDRGWLPLQTPAIRRQGWSRREVFPLQVALAHPPPQVLGRRPKLPDRWNDQELFAALAKECKKLLKVLW